MTSIKQAQKHIDALERQWWRNRRRYLRPLIKAEFKKVRKKYFTLSRILFGNTGFLVTGEPEEWGSSSVMGFSPEYYRTDTNVPKDALRLYQLCALTDGDMDSIGH